MSFGDVKTREGQQALNNHLASKSYIEGWTPTKSDNVVFETMGTAPPGDLFHALRWFNHINSFTEAERKAFTEPFVMINAASLTGTATAKPAAKKEDDDDCDLFGESDEEDDAEKEKIREERLAAYAAKKGNKPALIAKSMVKLDVKPWDDETDMVEMERLVRTIEQEGLVWGVFKLAPVAFGVKKLVCSCVIEDDKVSTQDLEDKITAFDELVQSVDIVAFNKL
jgi:elongation factor 1-beta